MRPRAIVGWDCDGVKYDFEDSYRQYLVHFEGFHPEDLPSATQWEFYKTWGQTTQQFIDFCHAGVDAGVIFRHGLPHYRVRENLHRLIDAGCEIVVITNRFFGSPGASEDATRWWYAHNDVPYHRMYFSEDKREVPTDFFIDDNVDNYDDLATSRSEVWLRDQPWNREWKGEPVTDRRRVDCLDCFTDRVLDAIGEDAA